MQSRISANIARPLLSLCELIHIKMIGILFYPHIYWCQSVSVNRRLFVGLFSSVRSGICGGQRNRINYQSIGGSIAAYHYIYFVILFSLLIPVNLAVASDLSVPAEFVRDLRAPGKSEQILRPSAIFIDQQFSEVFVADPGHNRIVIFDSAGIYLHEFGGGDHFSTPLDIAVDADGFVWVLGTTRTGRRLSVFDFDGLFVREVSLPVQLAGTEVRVTSFDLDSDNNPWLLDGAGKRLFTIDDDGNVLKIVDIFSAQDEQVRREQVIGKIRVFGKRILVPISSLGAVYTYDLNGSLIQRFGIRGTQIGELNFPAAAIITSDSLLLVLDKHRYNVVCYSLKGRFKGEFGGRGNSPGWFYHPTLLDIDRNNQLYIGQIFNNRIQVCRLPRLICPDSSDTLGTGHLPLTILAYRLSVGIGTPDKK